MLILMIVIVLLIVMGLVFLLVADSRAGGTKRKRKAKPKRHMARPVRARDAHVDENDEENEDEWLDYVMMMELDEAWNEDEDGDWF